MSYSKWTYNEKVCYIAHIWADKENTDNVLMDFDFTEMANLVQEFIESHPANVPFQTHIDNCFKTLVDEYRAEDTAESITSVPYFSVWDGCVEVETSAMLNLMTGEITNIEVVEISGLGVCEREYILYCGEEKDVYHGVDGYDNWVDISRITGDL